MPGNMLRYGQDFCLGTTGGYGGKMVSAAPREGVRGHGLGALCSGQGRWAQEVPMSSLQLFLSSDHRTLQRSAPRSWLQAVSLEVQPSFLSWWQATWPDPHMRLEYEGAPVLVSVCGIGALLGRGCCWNHLGLPGSTSHLAAWQRPAVVGLPGSWECRVASLTLWGPGWG